MKHTISILAAIAILLFCASPAQAQYLGQVSPQTYQQTLASNVACTGTPQSFNATNLGLTQHWATATVNSAMTEFQMQFFGVDAAGNATAISDAMTVMYNPSGVSNGILSATGSFPIIQVRATCLPSTTGTFSIQYSGSSASPLPGGGAYTTASIDKVLYVTQDATVSPAFLTLTAPWGSSFGEIIFYYQTHSMTGSVLTVQCGTTLTSAGYLPSIGYTIANQLGTQIFQIPAMPCPNPQVVYTHGTVVAGTTFSAEYIFSPPGIPFSTNIGTLAATGNNEGVSITEKGARWRVVSNPAAGSQASGSKSSAVGISHVADCVSFSAAATTAASLTALTMNLRDGASGAGTIIWTMQLAVPASTGQLVQPFSVCGLNLIGSNNTAMTLEFSAGVTNVLEAVTLTGYDVE